MASAKTPSSQGGEKRTAAKRTVIDRPDDGQPPALVIATPDGGDPRCGVRCGCRPRAPAQPDRRAGDEPALRAVPGDDSTELATALRVLTKKREADRADLEAKVLSNVNLLIRPYLQKVKRGALDVRQRAWLEIVESNLNEIVSPLSRRLSFDHVGFTPAEIRVAALVKQGKKAAEIALLLGISTRTVEGHRYAIRRRLGINGQHRNLRTCLLAIG